MVGIISVGLASASPNNNEAGKKSCKLALWEKKNVQYAIIGSSISTQRSLTLTFEG